MRPKHIGRMRMCEGQNRLSREVYVLSSPNLMRANFYRLSLYKPGTAGVRLG